MFVSLSVIALPLVSSSLTYVVSPSTVQAVRWLLTPNTAKRFLGIKLGEVGLRLCVIGVQYLVLVGGNWPATVTTGPMRLDNAIFP